MKKDEKWPAIYWHGWHGFVLRVEEQSSDEEIEIPPPTRVTTADVTAVAEMEESAFVRVQSVPSKVPATKVVIPTDYPDMGDLNGMDEDIKDKLIETYKEVYSNDKARWRASKLESFRSEALKKLQSLEISEPVIFARRRQEELKWGATMAEEHRLAWEETIEETLGFEIPLQERFVAKRMPRAPPPGPEPAGRGAFFIIVDGSGSMKYVIGDTTRFDIATGIIWTFIQEAKALNNAGRSHYMGIYGFDDCMYYPVPVSEYPPQPPLNPLPCDDIEMVERDFLRYWPDLEDGSNWMGMTSWHNTLPALTEDYFKFKGGDLIIVCDGDFNSEIYHLGADVSETRMGSELPEDPDNPTFLLKIQSLMAKDDCGSGYLFWIQPSYKPNFCCKHKGCKGEVTCEGWDHEKREIKLVCSRGHKWRESLGQQRCERHCGRGSCEQCKFVFLLLGKMFNHGKNIFMGTSVESLLNMVVTTLSDQQKRRLNRGEQSAMVFQEDDD